MEKGENLVHGGHHYGGRMVKSVDIGHFKSLDRPKSIHGQCGSLFFLLVFERWSCIADFDYACWVRVNG